MRRFFGLVRFVDEVRLMDRQEAEFWEPLGSIRAVVPWLLVFMAAKGWLMADGA